MRGQQARRLAALALALAAASALTPTSATSLSIPSPANLRVAGGEASWHATNDFRLEWDAATGNPPPSSVGYLVREPSGEVVTHEEGIPGEAVVIEHVHVSRTPGVYRAEVWFEGASGEAGPAASVSLRFDNVAPAPVRPHSPSGWVAAGMPATLRIEHPASPWPIAGIAGYAISVDRGSGSAPCAGPTRCTPAETDLRGGVDDDTISLGILPQGVSFARVVAVSASGMRSPKVESEPIRVDATVPRVALSGAPLGWANRPVRLTATASDALSGMAAAGPAGPFTAISVDEGPATLAAGDSVSATLSGDGLHHVAFFARDGAGNVADGEAGAPDPDVAIVPIDETPPRVSFSRAQDPAEPERIEATVLDSLSGPDSSRGTIAIRPVGTTQPFERLPTAAADGRLVAHWDSDAYPPGSYELRATGYDLAGNAGSGDRRSDGARMVLANPIKQPTELESGFGGGRLVWHRCVRQAGGRRCHRKVIESFERRPATRTVPYGRGTPFGGRLISWTGAPLADMPVLVSETFGSASRPARRTTVARTADDGTFITRLAPGPSREVEASFAGSGLLTRASGREERLSVLSSVRLRASAPIAEVGGPPIVFSGRIGHLDTSVPRGGMPVELQFRLPGSDWNAFRTVQTDRAGRFRYPYAFSDDDSRGVRFQFRAYLDGQEGWPYEPAASRPVIVTGR